MNLEKGDGSLMDEGYRCKHALCHGCWQKLLLESMKEDDGRQQKRQRRGGN